MIASTTSVCQSPIWSCDGSSGVVWPSPSHWSQSLSRPWSYGWPTSISVLRQRRDDQGCVLSSRYRGSGLDRPPGRLTPSTDAAEGSGRGWVRGRVPRSLSHHAFRSPGVTDSVSCRFRSAHPERTCLFACYSDGRPREQVPRGPMSLQQQRADTVVASETSPPAPRTVAGATSSSSRFRRHLGGEAAMNWSRALPWARRPHLATHQPSDRRALRRDAAWAILFLTLGFALLALTAPYAARLPDSWRIVQKVAPVLVMSAPLVRRVWGAWCAWAVTSPASAEAKMASASSAVPGADQTNRAVLVTQPLDTREGSRDLDQQHPRQGVRTSGAAGCRRPVAVRDVRCRTARATPPPTPHRDGAAHGRGCRQPGAVRTRGCLGRLGRTC